MADKQTAGRDRLGAIAPQFAALNDDVLFGEVWAREEQLSARDRSMITIAALFSAGLYPQLRTHLELGKAHGITREEAVEIVTQLAFYCGWPRAWSTFPMIAEIWGDDDAGARAAARPTPPTGAQSGRTHDAHSQEARSRGGRRPGGRRGLLVFSGRAGAGRCGLNRRRWRTPWRPMVAPIAVGSTELCSSPAVGTAPAPCRPCTGGSSGRGVELPAPGPGDFESSAGVTGGESASHRATTCYTHESEGGDA